MMASRLGIEKVKLTGGELLVRKEVMQSISGLGEIDGIKEIGITTNGTLLLTHLKRLKQMGLRRINTNLDTLSEDLFYQITGSRQFLNVLQAIHQALEQGFQIKKSRILIKSEVRSVWKTGVEMETLTAVSI